MSATGPVVFPSLSRAAATYTEYLGLPTWAQGIQVDIDITNVGGAGTLTVSILTHDPAALVAVETVLLASAALAATGHTIIKVHPSMAAVANLVAAAGVPAQVGIRAVVGANAVVFSVSAQPLH